MKPNSRSGYKLAFLAAALIAFAMAWFLRPISLREEVEQAHLKFIKRDDQQKPTTYAVRYEDIARFDKLLRARGTTPELVPIFDDNRTTYTVETPFLFFWHQKVKVTIREYWGGSDISFEPDLWPNGDYPRAAI